MKEKEAAARETGGRRMKDMIKALLGNRGRRWVFLIGRGWREIPRVVCDEWMLCRRMLRDAWEYRSDPDVILCGLRTAAHMVDKGLQVDECERGRGKSPYAAAKELHRLIEHSEVSSDASYGWATEVISQYEEFQGGGQQRFPKHASLRDDEVTRETLLQIIKTRRSVRHFSDEPIAEETLRAFADVANWAPSSCNRQPIRLFITQEAKTVRRCLNQCAGATCLGTTPCFVAVSGDRRPYTPRDRHLPYVDVALGLQNMLLLAHAYGIEGTILNWMHATNEQDRQLRCILGIPQYYEIVVALILGYPARGAPPPARKDPMRTYTIVP